MKKTIIYLLLAAMLSCAACGEAETVNNNDSNNSLPESLKQ